MFFKEYCDFKEIVYVVWSINRKVYSLHLLFRYNGLLKLLINFLKTRVNNLNNEQLNKYTMTSGTINTFVRRFNDTRMVK